MSDDLERQLALERLEFDALQAERDELSRRLADLERQLADARNAALEEAAGVAEAFEIEWRASIDGNRNMIVNAIRVLKDKPNG
jgi:predicted  nucleic acid-binding Zn-ribbon protein